MPLTNSDLTKIEKLINKSLDKKLDKKFEVYDKSLDDKLNKKFAAYDKSLNKRLDARFAANNDILMGRIIEVLKNYPTRDELYTNFVTKTEFAELKSDVNTLKDDMVGVKSELSLLNTSMQSLAKVVEQTSKDVLSLTIAVKHGFQRYEQEIQAIKSHIQLKAI